MSKLAKAVVSSLSNVSPMLMMPSAVNPEASKLAASMVNWYPTSTLPDNLRNRICNRRDMPTSLMLTALSVTPYDAKVAAKASIRASATSELVWYSETKAAGSSKVIAKLPLTT